MYCNKQMYHGTLHSKTNTKLFFCFVFTGSSEATNVTGVDKNTKTFKKLTVKDNNKTKTKKASEFFFPSENEQVTLAFNNKLYS